MVLVIRGCWREICIGGYVWEALREDVCIGLELNMVALTCWTRRSSKVDITRGGIKTMAEHGRRLL